MGQSDIKLNVEDIFGSITFYDNADIRSYSHDLVVSDGRGHVFVTELEGGSSFTNCIGRITRNQVIALRNFLTNCIDRSEKNKE